MSVEIISTSNTDPNLYSWDKLLRTICKNDDVSDYIIYARLHNVPVFDTSLLYVVQDWRPVKILNYILSNCTIVNSASIMLSLFNISPTNMALQIIKHPAFDVNYYPDIARTFRPSTALESACMSGKEEIVRVLIDIPGIKLTHALYSSINKYNITIIQLLMTKININTVGGFDVYHNTVQKSLLSPRPSIIKFLISIYPPIINMKMYDSTLLNYAIRYYADDEVIKLLLSYPDIDVNMVSFESETALNIACTYNSIDAVKLLLAHPDINIEA